MNTPVGHPRESDEAQRIVRRLTGQSLPPVELTTSHAINLPLQAHIYGRVVIYMVPGKSDSECGSEGSPADDIAQHRDYVKHRADFRAQHVKILCISSQSQHELAKVSCNHLLISDPELRLADALDLPTTELEGRRGYSRLTLVTNDGRIAKVFYPVSNPAADATRVIAWMKTVGWWR